MGKHFALEQVTLPAIDENSEGKVLTELLLLSVDPYMRGRMKDVVSYFPSFTLGSPANGSVIVKVIKSLLPDVEVGKIYAGSGPWQRQAVFTEKAFREGFWPAQPEGKHTPLESNLGTFGMPGATAYFGYLELCKPKAGETLVVSGAAGAVGHLVVQIGKIKGCRVVAIAGSEEKLKYLTELGCDAVINYKTAKDMKAAVKEAAPNGVDQYFDNVGGPIKDAVFANLNDNSRVSSCGAISSYNLADPQNGPNWEWAIIIKQITISGFLCTRWLAQWPEGFKEMAQWCNEGKLKHDSFVIEGFENTVTAFNRMMSGDNIGKVVVKV